jgi:hypothetical protein
MAGAGAVEPDSCVPCEILLVVSSAHDAAIDAPTLALTRGLARRGRAVCVAGVYDSGRSERVEAVAHCDDLQRYPGARASTVRPLVADATLAKSSDARWILAMAARIAQAAEAHGSAMVIADGYDVGRLALVAKALFAPQLRVVVRLKGELATTGVGAQGSLEAALLGEYLGAADAFLVSEESVAAQLRNAFSVDAQFVLTAPFWTAVDVDALGDRAAPAGRPASREAGAPPFFSCLLDPSDDRGVEFLLAALGEALPKQALEIELFGVDAARLTAASAKVRSAVACAPADDWDPNRLHKAVALVYPSSEPNMGVPLVVTESLAAGCPVIASDRPHSIRALVEDAQPGVLVQEGDFEGLAEAMLQLVWDDEARGEFAVNAQRALEEFSFDACVTAPVMELLDRLGSSETAL